MGIIYSTDPDFQEQPEKPEEPEMLPPQKQNLLIRIEKKDRGGKTVTIVENFIGKTADLETLGKLLKSKCGAGGTVKNGLILIQGDFRQKAAAILAQQGFKTRGG